MSFWKTRPELISELRSAVRNGDTKKSAALLKRNPDMVAGELSDPSTPLTLAVDAGHKDIVELLLAHGGDVNAKDRSGNTPLIIAVREGRKEIVELLLAHGANVNAENTSGSTPLTYAKDSAMRELQGKMTRKPLPSGMG